MVYIFGDVHFSCLNPWNLPIGEKIISWFTTRFADETSKNYAIFAGDITERDINAGEVIDQVDKLFNFMTSHFKKVYIVMGNHDLKLYKNKMQYSLKFLKRKYNVEIIEKITDLNLDSHIIRCCPYMRLEGISLDDYYSRFDWTDYPEADLTIGHWNKVNGLMGGVDVSKMKTKHFALGHIHTRIDSDYMGSLAPNNISEYTPNQKRVFKILNSDGSVSEEEIPHFVTYTTIKYPDPVIELQDNCVHIYTVDNVKSVNEAKAFYSNYFVKSIVNTNIAQKDRAEVKSDFIIYEDNLKAVDAWLKETKFPLSRNAYIILKNTLKNN